MVDRTSMVFSEDAECRRDMETNLIEAKGELLKLDFLVKALKADAIGQEIDWNQADLESLATMLLGISSGLWKCNEISREFVSMVEAEQRKGVREAVNA